MRIHFTRADLARTYLADGPDPLWELVNSLQALQSRYGQSAFARWRKQVAHDLRRTELAAPVRDRLFAIAPNASYFPDLLTPPEAALGLDEGIEAILSTPRQRIRTELGRLNGPAGPWLDDLASGRAGALDELGELLHSYYSCAVAPYWNHLRVRIDSDVAARRQLLRDGRAKRLLASFQPMMRWQDPVLELANHPSGRDIHLDGRGIVFVPSYFGWCHPVTIYDATLPQVVVYPVEHDLPERLDGTALAKLLGPTRATILLAARGGRTTSELAVRLGLAAATVSHHTGILREAGLVASRRRANTVQHTLTPLGAALVRQSNDTR